MALLKLLQYWKVKYKTKWKEIVIDDEREIYKEGEIDKEWKRKKEIV